MQSTFFDLLKEENKKGTTILFSSHILSEVQKLCHRVAIIKDGGIIAVEQIDTLRKNSYVKVMLELAAPVSQSAFHIKGISDLHATKGSVSFLYSGDVNAIIKVLSSIKLRNVSIEEPELEEIFMHYYQRDPV